MTAKGMALGGLVLCCAAGWGCAASTAGPDAPKASDTSPRTVETTAAVAAVPASNTGSIDWQSRVDAEALRVQAKHPGSDVRIVVEGLEAGASTPLAGHGETAARAPTGSTIKPLTVFAALQLGLDPEATLDCSGSVEVHGTTVQDYRDHGTLSVTEAVARSSNVGIARIAERVGADALYAGTADLVPLPPRAELDASSAVLTVMGHASELSLEELVGGYRSVLSDPTHGATVMAMLHAAVGPGGTGRAGWVEGMTRGGKTGTAAHGDKHDALFVGVADVEGQLVIIAVSVAGLPTSENGGGVAAPVFARLLSRTGS